jgi:effector-binding domain-containing protein
MLSPRVLAIGVIAAACLIGSFPSFAQAPAQPAPAPGAPPAPPSAAPPPPAPPNTTRPGDAFGEEVMLTERTVIARSGNATWDNAFETLVDAFKSLAEYLKREGIKPAGSVMTVYTSTDDTGFQFQAIVPIGEEPKNPPRGDLTLAKSPAGRALKFVHRGSYDAMDWTYERITNYLDEKRLEARELFIEEYVTDPVTTPEDNLVINVLVPLK